MAGFGLPNIGQLAEAFRKAQQIQKDAQKLQEELDLMEIAGKSENGKVSIWLSGNQQPLKVEIKPELMQSSKEEIEETILDALQNAYTLSTTTMKSRMEELTGGLNLPGMGGEI
tara:strand:- start:294 stop:635 length:342 start_codon:yes stop_codon:yes gene_type:complete